MYLQNRNGLTDLENELMVTGVGGKVEGRNSQGFWDGQVHTVIFEKDNQQGPTV